MRLSRLRGEGSISLSNACPESATGWALRGVLLAGGLMERLDGASSGQKGVEPSFVFRRFRLFSSVILPSNNRIASAVFYISINFGIR